MSCYGDHFGPFWSILVHFGAPHVRPHNPSMTCSDSYPLSSIHLIQQWIIFVTQDKFETLLLCWPFGSILVHFGPFWCTSWVTPPPLHDCFWLLPPFKCPFNPEMDHISHWGHIQKKIFIVMLWWPFWSILVHFGAHHGRPHDPSSSNFHSHQRYVSYASRAFKCNQSHLPISIHSGDIDLTWALTMGKSGKKWIFRSK